MCTTDAEIRVKFARSKDVLLSTLRRSLCPLRTRKHTRARTHTLFHNARRHCKGDGGGGQKNSRGGCVWQFANVYTGAITATAAERNRHFQKLGIRYIYARKCYIFFLFFRPPSLWMCVLRVRAHATRAVEMTQELIAFRRYMVPQGVVWYVFCGLQIAIWCRGGGWWWSSARGRRKEKITPEPSSGGWTRRPTISFISRREESQKQWTRRRRLCGYSENTYRQICYNNISYRTLNTVQYFGISRMCSE